MAVTLAQASLLAQNDQHRAIIETFVIESVVLDRIPLIPIQGTAFSYREESTLPGVEFRAVNAGYTESTGTFNQKTESLVIMGGDADVDTFIERQMGQIADQREAQERAKVKASVYKYQDTFVNGDVAVDANAFDGLKKRLTGGQVIAAGANGLPVVGTSDNDRHAFFDQLDAVISAAGLGPGDNGALYMNNLILGKIRSSARRIGGFDMTIDEFGRSIETYNGIALRDIGKKADGSLIIPQTEVQGTATTASSVYAVRFGDSPEDRGVTGLIGSTGTIEVRDLGELETKPAYRTRIEGFVGMAVFGPGAARLTGVLNA